MENTELPIIVRDGRRTHFFTIDNILLDQYGKRLGAYGLAVYMALCRFANRQSECWPSYQTIAERVGMSRRQVIREIKKLETLGLIAVQPQYDEHTGEQRSNLYILLEVCAPQSEGDDSQSRGNDSQSPPPTDTRSWGSARQSGGSDWVSRSDDSQSCPPRDTQSWGDDSQSREENLNNNTYELEENLNNNGGGGFSTPDYIVEKFAYLTGADPTEKEDQSLAELALYPRHIIRDSLAALKTWLVNPDKETIRNKAAWVLGTARRKYEEDQKRAKRRQEAANLLSRQSGYVIPEKYRDIIIG